MKKYIVTLAIPMAVMSLAIAFIVPVQTQAQVAGCPAGYTCTPITSQPVGCPAGYTCTPVASSQSSSFINSSNNSNVNSTASSCYTFPSNLSLGSTGSQVVSLQNWLIQRGFSIPALSQGVAKGYFGNQTVTTLQQYQKSVGLTASGNLDTSTRTYINGLCTINNSTTPTNSSFPSILSLSTNSAAPGTTVLIYVTNVPQNSPKYTVYLDSGPVGGVVGATLSSDGSYMSFIVPNIAAGNYQLNIAFGTGAQMGSVNKVPFTIVSATINLNNPTACPAGDICFPIGNLQVCPVGYTCVPTTVNCPSGYTCMTVGLTSSTTLNISSISGPSGTSAGTPMIIYGSGFASGDLVYFSGNGITVKGITPNSVSTSQISLTIPSYNPGTYFVQVGSGDARSNTMTFPITGGNIPGSSSVTVTSPTAGTVWSVGNQYQVNWTSSGNLSGYNIYLSGGGNSEGYSKLIGTANANQQSLTYTPTTADLPAPGGYTWAVIVCPANTTTSSSLCGLSGSLNIIAAGTNPPINGTAPVISTVVGPTTLTTTVAGIWTLYAYNAEANFTGISANWGDGSPVSNGVVVSSKSVQIGHQFTQSGTFTITFTVTDANGLTVQKTQTVQVM